MIIYGLKGMAAYAEHAGNIGKVNPEVNAFFTKHWRQHSTTHSPRTTLSR